MTKVDRTMYYLSFASLFALAAFVLVSNALCSLIHIFAAIPVAYFLYRIYSEKKFQLTGSQASLLLLVLFGIVSVVLAPEMSRKVKAISKLKYFLMGYLMVFAYGYTFTNWLKNKHIRFLATLFAISVSVASIAGAIGVFTGFNPLRMKPSGPRSSGGYGMVMTYGYGMQFVMVLFLGALIYYNDVKQFINRNILIFATLVGFMGLYLSYTRGAMVGLVCAFPFLLYQKSKKAFVSLLVIAALLVGVVTTVMLMGGSASSRFLMAAESRSNTLRLSQYQAALYAFKERPFTGIGYRNFEANSVALKEKYDIPHKDFGGHAHNNFLELLAGTGIGGFLALLMFHIFWFFELLKRKDFFGKVGPAFVVALFVSGQFQNTITDSENMYLIMSFYALSQIGMYPDLFLKKRAENLTGV